MRNELNIPSPCAENFQAMPGDKKEKLCGVCQTKVVDFTGLALEDIHSYFKTHANQKICGHYNTRHTNRRNWLEKQLNKIEFRFCKTPFKKAALLIISLVLVLSACQRKTVGKLRYSSSKKHEADKTTGAPSF